MFDLPRGGAVNLSNPDHRLAAELLCARAQLELAATAEPSAGQTLESTQEHWTPHQVTQWNAWERGTLRPARDRWYRATELWSGTRLSAPTMDPVGAAYWVLFDELPTSPLGTTPLIYQQMLVASFAMRYAAAATPGLAP